MIFLSDSSWQVKQSVDKGRGLYTKQAIPPGTIIGDYLGTVIHPRDVDNYEKGEHFYSMYYHDYAAIFPDLTKPDLYLINHSCTPNSWIYIYKGHTLFFSLRHIFPGEEITISYQLAPQTVYCKPCTHQCICESLLCSGTMHLSKKNYSAWTKANKEITNKTKRQRINYGKELPLLKEYPKIIPDNSIYPLFSNMAVTPAIVEETKLPLKEILRESLRETGRTLTFPKLDINISGIIDNVAIVTI